MQIKIGQDIIDFLRGKNKKSKKIKCFGKNNIIELNKNFQIKKASIRIYGDNNIVKIDTDRNFKLDLNVGTADCPVNNCRVHIGADCTSNGVYMILLDDNSQVIIGKDCMFSASIKIWASDTHTIFDPNTNQVLNMGKKISIGDHCWIGYGVVILKDVELPSNTICGFNSVITRAASQKIEKNDNGIVLVGNPARVVKKRCCVVAPSSKAICGIAK